MDNRTVKHLVGDIPHMRLDQADRLTALMEEQAVQNVLELGFAHGVSTCYMAAALTRTGGGHIVTIDKDSARHNTPNIEALLARIGQTQTVTVCYEPTSYNWRLMKFLEAGRRFMFDLCYIDGAHSWFVDGLAFFLVHQLLKPGGWIIFDDLDWTYATSPSLAQTEWVRTMPEEERTTPHVRKIYELLVKPHPQYHNFRVDHEWAYAQKRHHPPKEPCEREIVRETVVEKCLLIRSARRLLSRLNFLDRSR